jgi:predicted phage-related endonuclease
MAIQFTNYDPRDRAAWLALREEFRKRGVGGSELASVAGVPGAFSSPYAQWAERTGRIARRESTSAYLADGRDIEAIVASRFEDESGLKIRRRYAIITNTDTPHLFADVDGFIGGPVNSEMGWEGKTYDVRSRKFDNGCPPSYTAQVTGYMAVTGKRRWVLTAWAYGQGIKNFYFTLDPNDKKPEWACEMVVLTQAEVDAAEIIAADFMAYVERDEPPSIDGSDATTQALREIYPVADAGSEIDLEHVRAALDAIGDIDARIKELEEQKESMKNVVIEAMGESENGTATGWRVTFKNVETRRLDTKAAQAALGEELEPFYKTTSARVLRVTKAKK